MANIRLIKGRIRGIQSTIKITKAMEMVAASKMRRAQERDLQGRPYDTKIRQVLGDLAAAQPPDSRGSHALLQPRDTVNSIAILHITSDRGLCGGFNGNVNRQTVNFIRSQNVPVKLITVGRKGRDFMLRFGFNVVAEFTGLGDRPGLIDTTSIARILTDDFISKSADVVYISFGEFVSTAVQRPVMKQILPIQPMELQRAQNVEYIFEPSSQLVLDLLLPRFVEMQVFHAILESIASEQSARMVAMRNATDNAMELIDELTLTYNKARQEMITKEILDITAGAVTQ
ncbi:MAG: ATP synthase F1 subunit gamma [Dehalococcoidia bacterium]|nr:ATP synthase F1 subunit gamma [Dehalococcoidia bacterium]MDZ4247170.1 ATP synthase F1 subunit gamma [Dehalococcoidia bacterium]